MSSQSSSSIMMVPRPSSLTSSSASGFVPPPAPSLNGGLYTGAPFAPNAPWRNYPVKPDAGYYNFGSLAQVPSAPPAAKYMVPGGGLRAGNNTPLIPPEFANSRVNSLNALCIPSSAFAPSATPCCDATPNKNGMRQFVYL